MAKYLFLKHYRGAPEAVNDVPMAQWTPQEIEDHVQYMNDFADRLKDTGEYVDSQALSPEGTFVRYDGEPFGTSDAHARRQPRPTHLQCRPVSAVADHRTRRKWLAL